MSDTEEMTMEEILASIRRYVADDAPEMNQSGMEYTSGFTADVIRLTDAVDNAKAPPKADFVPFAKAPEPDYRAEAMRPKAEVRPIQEPQHYPFTPPSSIPTQGFQKSPPPSMQQHAYNTHRYEQYEPQIEEVPPPIQEAPSIISNQAFQATNSAFSKLNEVFNTIKTEKENHASAQKGIGVTAIESFVIEMARPMIRQWIDQHLPKLVDKLVTQEIEKLMEDLRRKLF